MSGKTTPGDRVIEEVSEARSRISARFDHDPARLVAHYMELQQQYQDRLLDPTRRTGKDGKSAA